MKTDGGMKMFSQGDMGQARCEDHERRQAGRYLGASCQRSVDGDDRHLEAPRIMTEKQVQASLAKSAGGGGAGAGAGAPAPAAAAPAHWQPTGPCRTAGSRPLHELQACVTRLMRHHQLASRHRRRFRATTDSRHPFPVAPNVLDRQFAQGAPDRAWVTDITYMPTGEGWLYLAVILGQVAKGNLFTGTQESTNVPLVTNLRQGPWERYQEQSMLYGPVVGRQAVDVDPQRGDRGAVPADIPGVSAQPDIRNAWH